MTRGARGEGECAHGLRRCGASLAADARFCPACAAPVQATTAPAEERKLVTVLFADLVGSTELADAQDPERTRALLDRFYESMAAEIERVGGTVEKFVGDAVMAAFGAPAAQEDHAERALHAALAMQRRLGELFGDRLALRIGVNTGEVVVGRPREGSSFVTGDAVNVGARLEQAAAPGEILAGERTVLAARGAFEFGEPVTVEAKGKAGGLECRRLVRALSLMRPRGVGGLRRAFVGREAELAQLQEAYGAVAAGEGPQLVTILGDAGVGKTRLVRELWEWFAAQDSPPLRRTGPLPLLRTGHHLLAARRGAQGALPDPRERSSRRSSPSGSGPPVPRPHHRAGATRRPAPARRARAPPRLVGRLPRRSSSPSGRPSC